MKKTRVIAIWVIAAFIALSFIKDAVIKTSVEKGVEIVTGLKLGIRSLRVGVIKTSVNIRGLKLYNPKSFKDRVMLEMPEIYVYYNLPSILFRKEIYLKEIRIDLKEFWVIKNANGELNLDSLNVVKARKSAATPEAEGKGTPAKIRIDALRLKIGKVVYKDYSKGPNPSVKEFNVNIDERYSDITNPYAVVSLIVVKALANTGVASLAGFDVNGLSNTVSGTLSTAKETAAKATAAAHQTVKKTAEQTQKVAKETRKVVDDAAKGLQEAFKNPFRGK